MSPSSGLVEVFTVFLDSCIYIYRFIYIFKEMRLCTTVQALQLKMPSGERKREEKGRSSRSPTSPARVRAAQEAPLGGSS